MTDTPIVNALRNRLNAGEGYDPNDDTPKWRGDMQATPKDTLDLLKKQNDPSGDTVDSFIQQFGFHSPALRKLDEDNQLDEDVTTQIPSGKFKGAPLPMRDPRGNTQQDKNQENARNEILNHIWEGEKGGEPTDNDFAYGEAHKDDKRLADDFIEHFQTYERQHSMPYYPGVETEQNEIEIGRNIDKALKRNRYDANQPVLLPRRMR